ncbi:MAG: trigger factor [Cytophagales bacterium]
MNVTLDKKDATLGSLRVVLTEADYKPKVDSKLKEYSKTVAIKGFRQGKAPVALVSKLYGKSILADEVFKIADASVTDYLKENKLSIVGRPLPSETEQKAIDFDTQKEFEFVYDLGLVPEFAPSIPSSHEVYTIELNDSSLTETIDSLRKQYGKMVNPEKSVDAEDFLFGRAKKEGEESDVYSSLPLNKVVADQLAQFIGLSADSVVKFDLRKVFGDNNDSIAYVLGITKEEAADVTGVCEFKVEKISRSENADLDQEFFDRVFGKDAVTTEEEFKNKLKEVVGDNYKRESEYFNKFSLKNKVLSSTNFSLSKDFLKRWIEYATEGKTTQDAVENDFNNYEKEMKWMYIVDKIATEKQIKVEAVEVKAKAKAMISSQFGNMPMNEEMEKYIDSWADNYLKENNGRNFLNLYDQALNDKVLDQVYGEVSKSEKTVSSDEFKKLVENA